MQANARSSSPKRGMHDGSPDATEAPASQSRAMLSGIAPGKVCFCCTARTSHILLGRLAESSEDDGPLKDTTNLPLKDTTNLAKV